MQTKTKFKDKKIFHKELLELINNLIDTYEKIETALTESLYSVEKDQYHFITRLLKTDKKNRTAHVFLSLLFKDIYKTELLSAKSGHISFLFALHFIKNILKSDLVVDNEYTLFSDFEKVINKFKTNLELISVVPTEDDLKEVISLSCQDEFLTEICWNALKISGLEGKIFIENSKNETCIIESKHGYSFNLKPYSFFLNNNTWQGKEVKVMTVDGFIENVSEIDNIIKSAYETKQPLVIVSQGFSEEVVSTFYINYQKNNLNIIPIRTKTDLNSLNIINDISVVCGCEPISSFNGQLLTFVKFDNLPTVDKIIINGEKITIENARTRANVSNQIRMLMEKRLDSHIIEDVQDLFDKRIKNLTSNSVIINLPNLSVSKTDEQRVKIDNAFRQIKTVLNYGFIKNDDLKKVLNINETKLEKIVSKTINQILTKEKYPLLSTYLSVAITGKTVLMLLSAAGRVELDII